MMDILTRAVISTAIAGVAGTGLGGLLGVVVHRNTTKTISVLLSFAAGVMLGVVCFDLLADAFHLQNFTLYFVIAGVITGYLSVLLLNSLLQQLRPQKTDTMTAAGILMALAIALHNLPEGMVIGAAYASDPVSGGGLLMTMVIGLHNIPEGMAVAVPLLSGGTGRLKTTALTALSGLPTVFGALLGYFMGALSPLSLSLALSFAGGAMFFVIFGELLPQASRMYHSAIPPLAVLLGMMLGLLLSAC